MRWCLKSGMECLEVNRGRHYEKRREEESSSTVYRFGLYIVGIYMIPSKLS